MDAESEPEESISCPVTNTAAEHTYNMITFIALPVIVSLLVVFRKFWSIFGRYYTSPLRHLPGPKSPSILYGYFREVSKASGVELFESWAAKYGKTYMYHELANVRLICLFVSGCLEFLSLDPLVVHHGHSRSKLCTQPP